MCLPGTTSGISKSRIFSMRPFYKFREAFSLFVILVRNAINPLVESATIMSHFVTALLSFFVLLCQWCFFAAEEVFCLIPMI